MTILALEFSSAQRSVAVVRGDTVAEAVEAGGRCTAAFGMIERVLDSAGIGRGGIDVIAIGLGPGSYTGIRSAIAIAQGWQLARGNGLVGVSSAEAIAMRAQAGGIEGQVQVVIDAQRGEIYHAGYELSKTAVREVTPLRIIAPTSLSSDGTVVGPEATRWFPAAKIIFPGATLIARLAADRTRSIAGVIEPIYLRETSFVKAPPPRQLD